MNRWLIAACLAAWTPAGAAARQSGAPDTTRLIRGIEILRYDVFSPAETTGVLPKLANGLHFTTRAAVVRRELLFQAGLPYDSARVAETARNLRSLGVFRDVAIDTVRSDSGLLVRVTTADGWSTRPITNLNTTGSTWVPTIGIEELNFLGTATLVSVRYRIDPDRSTLTTLFRQPRLFAGRVGVTMQYAHLSDGDLVFGQLSKPFFSLSTRTAWQVYGEGRHETILRFFEGETDPRITLQRRYALGGGAAAWALRAAPSGYLRLGLGGQIRRDEYADEARVDTLGHTVTAAVGPFLQWRAARFLVSRGLEGFARAEDVDVSTVVNLGAQVTPRAFGYPDDGIVPFLTLRTGFGRADRFVQLAATGIGRFAGGGLDSGSVHLAGTAFVLPAPGHLAVLHGAVGWQRRPAPGAEFDLGLGLGPRAFKQHAFTGDRAFFTTAEYRYTVTDNFYNLTAIGLAGFVDYGGAWYSGSERRTGWDFGVGLRFGLTRATEIQTNRLDLACRPRNEEGPFHCRIILQRGFAFSSSGRLDR
ncbi:MAG TPA: BamA/TamA family outer membrane protein [Gemmatimonadales bacterium]